MYLRTPGPDKVTAVEHVQDGYGNQCYRLAVGCVLAQGYDMLVGFVERVTLVLASLDGCVDVELDRIVGSSAVEVSAADHELTFGNELGIGLHT